MNHLIISIGNVLTTVYIDEKDIRYMNGMVNEDMKLTGWILIKLCANGCLIIRMNAKEEIEEWYMLSKDEVLEVNGKDVIRTIKETIDKEDGIRFEGSVFEGIPFGIGLLYDENGNKIYEGTMINWKRIGYGTSFNESGMKEYEGYWLNDLRSGNGRLFNVEGNIIYEGNWFNGKKIGCDYEGDGSNIQINVKHLKLLDNCVLKAFDVSIFLQLESLIVGDECFMNVDTFLIDGLNHLKSIKIGNKSFTTEKYWFGNNPSRSFHVLNCFELESIEIGSFSFSDYAGQFELKNLPSLSSVIIGEISTDSRNFYYSSFVVENLSNLRSIELGDYSFCNSKSTVISNLPSLNTIKLGEYALQRRQNDDSSSLEMKNLPQLEEITSDGYCFYYTRAVIISNIPNLRVVNLPNSLKNVRTKSISNVSPLFANHEGLLHCKTVV